MPNVITPSPDRDRALNGIVGVVAICGFVLGIAWPRLLDVKVGPDVPSGGPAAKTPPPDGSSSAGASAPKPLSATAPAPTAESTAEDAASPTNKQQVVIGTPEVLGCKNKKGEKIDDCGKIAFEEQAKKHLDALARCPSAIGLEGKLTLSLTLNFDKNDVLVDVGKKKSDLPSSTQRGVVACAGQAFKALELEEIRHTHPRYTLSIPVAFYPPGKEPPTEGKPEEQAATSDAEGLGSATVKWEKALVRETPDEGKVVARLPQGTRIKLLEQKDDWYRIESSKGKGWVYRQAIGK